MVWPVGPLIAQLILIQTQTSDQPFKASLLSELTNYARPALPLIPPDPINVPNFPIMSGEGWLPGSIGIAPVGNLIFVASESLDRGRAVSTPNTAATFVKKLFCFDQK